MRRTLRWQWWAKPFGGGEEWADDEATPAPIRDGAFYDDVERRAEDVEVRPLMVTSTGPIPADMYHDPTKAFNWWIGHASFVIDEDSPHFGYVGMKSRILRTPGVETIEVPTPLRFRIAIGLAFDDREVRRAIDRACGVVRDPAGWENPDAMEIPDGTRDAVLGFLGDRSAGRHRAALVLPNLRAVLAACDTRGELEARLATFRKTRDAVGGILALRP